MIKLWLFILVFLSDLHIQHENNILSPNKDSNDTFLKMLSNEETFALSFFVDNSDDEIRYKAVCVCFTLVIALVVK